MNQPHHDEQMEAMRIEFDDLWKTVLLPVGDHIENSNNRRSNNWVTINGETKTTTQWGKKAG